MNLLKHECDFFWLYQDEDKVDDDFEQPRTLKTRKGGSSQPAKQVWLKEKGVWLKEEGVWLKEEYVYATGGAWIIRCKHGQGHQGGIARC